MQRRWASEKIRNGNNRFKAEKDFDFEQDFDPCTRFHRATDSLMEIDRSTCKVHADYKKSFISTNILKVC